MTVIQGKFGTGSPEYLGVLAIYLCGSVIGTVWFSVLGSLAPLTGLHPMAQEVLSVAAASNLLSSALGALSLTYLGLPLSEKIYKILNKEETI
ncbi:DUF3100 domain-containing protein [Xenorhabdus anantnagensis]|uniref:DUF3100 domain-containing protein n=1 Tax=Xenorhabdus anantnagensis TaxID=3025875 RepID=A0ABT5LXF1_9GAMM|nr:DUF3100 domain-containing protein [Xenorhabdus anantnagensis]